MKFLLRLNLLLPFLFLSISLTAHAKITKYDAYQSNKTRFNFKEVCLAGGAGDSTIVELKTATELDCMGKVVNFKKFCEKKNVENLSYIRAYAIQKTKEVICQSAGKVVLTYRCSKNSRSSFCHGAKRGCGQLQNILAHNLEMVHSSIIVRDPGHKDLNCYYHKKVSLNSID
jgi:hypothetical protein